MISSRSHLPSVARTASVIDVVPYIKTQSVTDQVSAIADEPNVSNQLPSSETQSVHEIGLNDQQEQVIDIRDEAWGFDEDEEDQQVYPEKRNYIIYEPNAIDVPVVSHWDSIETESQPETKSTPTHETQVIDVTPHTDDKNNYPSEATPTREAQVIDVTPHKDNKNNHPSEATPTREAQVIDVTPHKDNKNNHYSEPGANHETQVIDVTPHTDNKNNHPSEATPTREAQVIDVTPQVEVELKQKTTKGDFSQGKVIDVTPQSETPPAQHSPLELDTRDSNPGVGGGLATTQGSFSTFLAPLNKDSFKEVVTGVEDKLRVVNQTLTMLTNSEGFEAILQEMLSAITLKTGELLNADRTTIYLLDEEKNELWSIVAKDAEGRSLEIRFPATQGIAGQAATTKHVINIPFDFYDDPRSTFAKQADKKNNYRTYTMLVLPLLNDEGELVSVVQLINKLKFQSDPNHTLAQRIDLGGFTKEDERVFEEFAPSIRLILESSRSFYVATQRQRAADALMKANQALSQSSLDLEDTLKRVMDEAKKLMNADRSTLWLIDQEREQLWTKIPIAGELREIRIPRNVGFAGIVAESKEPLMIPFDLYEDPRSETSKQTDQKSGYRTCSMLCMPVFNADGDLIGVTQLINKKKQGDWPAYDPAEWPKVPECWKSSFNRSDQEFMQIFNIQAGVALQNAKLFAEVKRQQQMQRDILRSLSNGVISTDKAGNVIAANESAKRLLGFCEEEKLEGRPVYELVRIKSKDDQLDENKFDQWFETAINCEEEKKRQQYYPDQVLESMDGQQHSVNLSINTIADVIDCRKVDGALVVMDDISDEKRLKSTMYRYMTQEVAEQLLASGDNFKMGGDRKEVTVLFSDIRSYTTLTESMQAEEVVQMLNEYFESMVDAVFKYKGTLDKYIGDAIMAVFGAFVPLHDHAWMAVQTAVEMRHRLGFFNQKRRENNQQEIKVGIGINSDEVISGNIGSSQRMELTSIGDGVNLGSRLEGASKQYGCDIVVSENTVRPCGDRIWYRELDFIRVKGKTKPVAIFELVGLRDENIGDDKKKVIEVYHKGRELYLQQKFLAAMNEFAYILEDMNIADKSSGLYLKRCQYWLEHPEAVETEWDDGVWTLTEK